MLTKQLMEKEIKLSSKLNNEIRNYLDIMQQAAPSDFLNALLYRLCRLHPNHESNEIILSKTLIIGRVYAAALERNAIKNQKKKKVNSRVKTEEIQIGDDFYSEKVVPLFKRFFALKTTKLLIQNCSLKP